MASAHVACFRIKTTPIHINMKNEIIDNQNNKRETQTIQTEMNLNNLQLCETQLVKV